MGPKLGYAADLVPRVGQINLASPLDILRDQNGVSQSKAPNPNPTENAEFAAKLQVPFMQARACIRNNIANAYHSGVYGNDQVTAFFATRCLDAFSAALRDLGMDDGIAATGFKVLVLQEIAPEAWQKSMDDLERGLKK